MSGFTRSFDASKYNFDKKDFDRENDTARPMFYMQDEVNPHTDEIIQVEMVKIFSPGEALNVYGGKVREIDRHRFAKEYEAFKKGETSVDGTPLSKWPDVASNVEFLSQLRAFGFQTVEDIAKMNDGAMRLFHGSLVWKKKAEKFVKETKEKAALEAQRKLMEETAAKDAQKDQAIAELTARLAALEAGAKNKGGRPKKIITDQTAAA